MVPSMIANIATRDPLHLNLADDQKSMIANIANIATSVFTPTPTT
jgi:hypothetical protein